jgi:predicted DNA-binding antitoxin AbrB/MazE fold protein
MGTITAVFENGVFRPTVPVDLPEGTTVLVHPDTPSHAESDPAPTPDQIAARKRVYEILSRRYKSGHHDTAERHNEHQP